MSRRLNSRFGNSRVRRFLRIATVLALALLSGACLHRHRAPSVSRGPLPPAPSAPGRPGAPPAPIIQGEEGIASWYGKPYHGRPTASGEIYNMYDMTAAHRTLPFGTQVRVHDLENGQEVVVRINDRGPFVEGRIIDLSYASAQAMHMPSTALVRLEILNLETSAGGQPGIFGVQVGAFRDRGNAERLKALIAPHYGPVTIFTFDRGDAVFYRVRVGHESSEEAAEALARNLRRASLTTQTFVVRLN